MGATLEKTKGIAVVDRLDVRSVVVNEDKEHRRGLAQGIAQTQTEQTSWPTTVFGCSGENRVDAGCNAPAQLLL
jgi:hypothetical protein